MKPKVEAIAKLTQKDSAVDGVMSSIGGGAFGSRNRGTFSVRLKDYDKRSDSATMVANRLTNKFRNEAGMQLFLMAAQDLYIGKRSANTSYQYRLRADDLNLLRVWTPKVKEALEKLPELTSMDADSENGGQEIMLNINRDKDTRLGVNADMLDAMLNNSFSQRQVATIYKTLSQYHVIMGLNEFYTSDAEVLKKLFVVNDDGESIPLSAFITFSSANAALSVAHQGQSATSSVVFNLADGVSLEQALGAIKDAMVKIALSSTIQAGFQGTAKTFAVLAASMPWLILAAVYIMLGVLYKSYIHPLTILSTLPSAGLGALLLMLVTGTQLTVIALIGILLLIGIVKKNAIMMIDFALAAERNQGLTPQQIITQACLI